MSILDFAVVYNARDGDVIKTNTMSWRETMLNSYMELYPEDVGIRSVLSRCRVCSLVAESHISHACNKLKKILLNF
jgi:hypothetical protein